MESFANQVMHSLIDNFVTNPIFVLSIFTARAFSFNLNPLQTSQSLSDKYFSSSYWTHHLSVSEYFLSIKLIIPSYWFKFVIWFFLSPYSMVPLIFSGISFHGVLISILNCFKILWIVSIKNFLWFPKTLVSQGFIAPCNKDLLSSGITFLGSKNFSTPSPSHSLHAPWGALKLKSLGSISSIEKPDTGHENFDEYILIFFLSKFSIYTKPSDKFNDVSTLSAILWIISFLTINLSTTISM